VAGDIANGYTSGFINIASLDFAGLIISTDYDFALGALTHRLATAGSMRLGLKLFYTNKLDEVDFAGQPVQHLAGEFDHPRYKAQANIGYSYKKFGTDWQVVYRNASKLKTIQTYEDTPVNDFPAYALVNASFGLRLVDAVSLQLAVNNVFDKSPPFSAFVNTETSYFDFIGRSYLLRVAAAF
jgi:outer membrane receptor protein involved in Fe transport